MFLQLCSFVHNDARVLVVVLVVCELLKNLALSVSRLFTWLIWMRSMSLT